MQEPLLDPSCSRVLEPVFEAACKQTTCDSPSGSLSPRARLVFDYLESQPELSPSGHVNWQGEDCRRLSTGRQRPSTGCQRPSAGGQSFPRGLPRISSASNCDSHTGSVDMSRTGSLDQVMKWSPSIKAVPLSPALCKSPASCWKSSPPPVNTPPPPWAPKDKVQMQPPVGRTGTMSSFWEDYKEGLKIRKLKFPDVEDSLPSMVDIVTQLGEFKAANRGVLCPDGLGGIVQGCRVQTIIMDFMDGTSKSDSFWKIWNHMWKKDQLIRTTQALDDIVLRFHSVREDPGKFMWMSRYCFIAQCEHEERPLDSIFATTTLKVCQLMFFLWLTMNTEVVEGLYRPPPEEFYVKDQGKHHQHTYDIKSWSDPSMFEERMKDPLSSSLPIHPAWFHNSVPLISEKGAFKKHCMQMMQLARDNPGYFGPFMHTVRSTLVHMQGSLRSHLDNVTMLQQKMLMAAMSGFMTFVSWYFKEHLSKDD